MGRGPVIFLLLLAACSRGPGSDARWSRIDGPALIAELAETRSADAPARVVVDVREPELFADGHIPGAINIPWPDAKHRVPDELDPGDDIILVCHVGPMGDELAEILDERGFSRFRNLAGGMNRWTGPLERTR